MQEFNSQEAFNFWQENRTGAQGEKTQLLIRYCESIGVPYEDKYRKRLNREIDKSLNFDVATETITETNQYANDSETEDLSKMPSAWDEVLGRFLSIDEYCDRYNLPKDQVRSSKLVAHVGSHMVYNIAFNATLHDQTGIDEETIKDVVRSLDIKPKMKAPSVPRDSEWVDILTYTDVHIGMDPSGNRNISPLYDNTYDEDEIFRRLRLMMDHAITFKRSNTIQINDLGDFADGLGGKTVRKHHDLPQNMDDKEAFVTACKFKLEVLKIASLHWDHIICNNVCADNHSGVFAYFINKAVESTVREAYPGVQYNLLEKFIEDNKVGKHTQILSHGKDEEALKFGFPAQADQKSVTKIDHYAKDRGLYRENPTSIVFCKGDSHQMIFDWTTSSDFRYFSYPAFSPASNWVGTNYKNGGGGIVFENQHLAKDLRGTWPLWF